MNEEEKTTMADFMEEIEKAMMGYRVGDVVKVKVIHVNMDEILVDMGSGVDGIIERDEFSDVMDVELSKMVGIGDTFDVFIKKIDDSTGSIVLSKLKADRLTAMDRMTTSFEDKVNIKVKVTEEVKGGAVALFDGIRVFIPLSQLGLEPEKSAGDLIGRVIEVRVIEFDDETNKIVGSRKAIIQEEREAQSRIDMEKVAVGDKLVGHVAKIMEYGAFVEAGALRGLLHISDMSWRRIGHPTEILQEGQSVDVVVSAIDKESNKLSFRLEGVDDGNPWLESTPTIQVGSIYTGRVMKFKPFGAFVILENGIEGLVHISNICEERINNPSSRLKIGQEVSVKVISIDDKEKKIGLSIKDANDSEDQDYEDYIEDEEINVTLGDLFAEKLKNLKF